MPVYVQWRDIISPLLSDESLLELPDLSNIVGEALQDLACSHSIK